MDPAYLDYAATTPLSDEVREAMAPFQSERFGNPSSLHRWGREASAALEAARARVAGALGARPSEIHFVRGGTESDNLAVLGGCLALRNGSARPRLVVSAIEHPAVLEAARHAHETGVAHLSTLDVDPDGSLDLDAVGEAIADGPGLVSAMWVNNETGLTLPVPEVAEAAAARGALVHTDASQAVGKVAVAVDALPIDLLTATGHKIHGPKGTGILFVREGLVLPPMLRGGGQERALRPGTEDVAGAVGFAVALEAAVAHQPDEADRLARLRDDLEERITSSLSDVRVNGGAGTRAPHVASLGFGGIPDGQTLLMALDLEGVAVSGGSACASGSGKRSHVLAALYGDDDPHAVVRYSFGAPSRPGDVDTAVEATLAVVERLRRA